MSELPGQIGDISLEEYELFQLLLQKKGIDTLGTQTIPRRTEISPCQLSFAQARLWFLSQLNPDSPLYNMPAAVRLKGALNIAALAQTFNEIVRRHEVLRTTFVTDDGQPVQIIAPTLTLPLPVVNLQELPEIEREAEVLQLATEEAQRPFNLTLGPLLRTTLLQLGRAEHVLLFTIHHIVSDGWSVEVLIREVVALYEAFCCGKPSPLPELPIQYADFAIWQRQWLQGEVLAKQLAYWQQQLSHHPPVLQLPTDRPRPLVQSFPGATKSFSLSTRLTNALKVLSQQEEATLFMTLLVAFQTLLYRYTGQEDILVGSPIANRNRFETERLIGFFVNTLVLRTDLSGNPSFRELLVRVRKIALEAYAHQELPFEKLVAELQPERDLSSTPLIQVMFALENNPIPILEFAGLTLSPVEFDHRTTKFDLILAITETHKGLSGRFEYNTDLFDAATIAKMVRHFQTMLTAIVTNPDQSISTLPLLTAAEQHQLLVEWNDTQTAYPQDKCIHQLFEAQVELTPDAVAVVFGDARSAASGKVEQQLSYQQLNQRANQLGHYLRLLGVKPETKVGICVERSLEMIIGLLGILKAGGAYVPLDPAHPQERLAYMLADAQVEVLLTQKKLATKQQLQGTHIVCLDTDWKVISQKSEENLVDDVSLTAKNLAYVIYTSGSTGKPKGVAVEHQQLLNYVHSIVEKLELTANASFATISTFAADLGNTAIFPALCTGGCLHVISQERATSPEALADYCDRHPIDCLKIVPSHLNALLNGSYPEQILPRKCLILGGEALSWKLVEKLQQYTVNCQIFNHYGPSEATIGVLTFMLKGEPMSGKSYNVPIGRPLANTQVYILDNHLQPVPIGIAGELYIAGDNLTRGYLNHPELTSQKFIPNPFSHEFGSQLYKTGDLARYLPDGNIEFLGRIDQQVKIRGFRIEPSEIELLLRQHPAIRESIVLAREDESGNKRLVAYFVLGQQLEFSVNDLRNFLKEKLPEYMIPSAFVQLQELPLTPNGKVDRQALPNPNATRPELDEVFVAPRTKEEKILAEIWSQVLGQGRVGIHDNFFALGGDSIRSIQVRSLAQQRGLSFSLQQMFQHQTIHELIIHLTKKKAITATEEQVLPFSLISEEDRLKLPDDVEDTYPLTMLQMGMIFHNEYDSNTPTYHNVISFHLQSPFNEQHLWTVIQQLVARHPILRTSFDLSHFSEPLQLVHKKVNIPLEVEDLRHLSFAEQQQTLTARFEAQKRYKFDWAYAPLLRFQIYRRSEEGFQFCFTDNHAILDGWSVAAMLTELFENYFSLLNGEVLPIKPAPAIAFRDFVALEKKALKSQECQQYWNQKLKDSMRTTLPRWSTLHKPTKTSEIRVLEVPISYEILTKLQKLAQRAKVPLKSVLVAAHMSVLSLHSGQLDVITILSSNGRSETTDGDWSLGLFLTPLPFRIKLSGGTWIDLAQQIFANEQEQLPYRKYPLAQIQINLGGQRLFETAVNFTHFHVYERLQKFSNLQILDSMSFEVTDFVLIAEFCLDVFSSQLKLFLMCNTSNLCDSQIEKIGQDYAQILAVMAQKPTDSYILPKGENEKEMSSLKESQEKELENINSKKLKKTKRKVLHISSSNGVG